MSANHALNGFPILLNVDAQADTDGCNSSSTNHIGANALRHASNGSSENELTSTVVKGKTKLKKDTQSVHSRPKRVALSIFTTLLERDWLLGVATLVVAFFTLDLVNVATDRLADGRVLNARFGIFSKLLDPVSVYDELSTASLNEYKSFVLDRYLSVYENSLNNDLRLLEAFRTAWSSAKLTRSDAIRKLVRALDASRSPDSTADSDVPLRDSLGSDWSSQVRSNVSHSCRFDDLIIDEAATRTVRLVTQSEFDYNLRLAHLVDNGEAYLNELRLIVRRTTFLLFVYIATMISYTFVSRFCEMFSVRFHLVRLRFVYTSGVAHANADVHR